MESIQRMKNQDRIESERAWTEYMERRISFAETYGTKHGRKMLRDLFDRTFLFATTINPKPDAMTYVREGQRNVALEIISHVPGIAAQVIEEWLMDMEHDILKRLEVENDNG